MGGQQDANTAFYTFTGTQLQNIFNVSQGQMGFYLTSSYNLAARLALPQYSYRDVFDGFDNSQELFLFQVQAEGRLIFCYNTGGASPQSYVVPAGTEDTLFGQGVKLLISLVWDGSTVNLFLNGKLVNSTSYSVATPNWTSTSSFTLGANDPHAYGGGYFSCDDAISGFQAQNPASAAASTTASSSASASNTTTGSSPPVSSTTTASSSAGALTIQGTSAEVSGTANGAIVTPSAGPAGLTGRLTVRGTGAVNFSLAGASFTMGGQQDANTAFYTFTGTQLQNIFNVSQGQMGFYLTSSYNLAARLALPQYSYRDVFDGFDNSQELFLFQVQAEGGRLIFCYNTGGASPQSYVVPAGTEDTLFGQGVKLLISLVWDGSTVNLFLNGKLVNSTSYSVATPNWTSTSSFTLGANDPHAYGGGYFSCDDAISGFQAQNPASAAASTTASSSAGALTIQGTRAEVSGTANGAVVTPSAGPTGLTGQLTVRGAGAVNFSPAGAFFTMGGQQNANTAFYTFTGAQLQNVFNVSRGQIGFNLTSSYNLAARLALPQYSYRDVFDGFDNSQELFLFQVQAEGGRLIFCYNTGGASPQKYTVPAGTENTLFGQGVTLLVSLVWDGTTLNLFLNGTLANSTPYSVATPNWTSASSFTLGANDPHAYGGGYFSCDDVIGELQVQNTASGATK